MSTRTARLPIGHRKLNPFSGFEFNGAVERRLHSCDDASRSCWKTQKDGNPIVLNRRYTAIGPAIDLTIAVVDEEARCCKAQLMHGYEGEPKALCMYCH